MYFKHLGDQLIRINRSYVDDLLIAVDRIFHGQAEIMHDRFETSGDKMLPVELDGVHDHPYQRSGISY